MSAQFTVQHLATKPAGWRVRSRRAGEHVVRIAFPPGRKVKGSGKVLEVLHPKKNPACEEGSCGPRTNPAELVIFTNPTTLTGERRKQGGAGHHKKNCQCPFCQRARKNPPTAQHRLRSKAVRDRATKIRGARLAGRNPSEAEQSVKLFEIFHGRDASEVINTQRSLAMRLDYAALGKLVALGFDDLKMNDNVLPQRWEDCPHLPFEGAGVMLASAPGGADKKAHQLYFIDGNQNLDAALADFDDIDTGKDLIDLGDVYFVVYEARKAHNDYKPTDWTHRFGRKTNKFPRLAYDKLKKEMALIGGEYFIDLSQDLSPGIEG